MKPCAKLSCQHTKSKQKPQAPKFHKIKTSQVCAEMPPRHIERSRNNFHGVPYFHRRQTNYTRSSQACDTCNNWRAGKSCLKDGHLNGGWIKCILMRETLVEVLEHTNRMGKDAQVRACLGLTGVEHISFSFLSVPMHASARFQKSSLRRLPLAHVRFLGPTNSDPCSAILLFLWTEWG